MRAATLPGRVEDAECCRRSHRAPSRPRRTPLPSPPQTWNRPQQMKIQEFAGDGIFTSSTESPDWASAHGLLPRFYNALKIKGYYPASEREEGWLEADMSCSVQHL